MLLSQLGVAKNQGGDERLIPCLRTREAARRFAHPTMARGSCSHTLCWGRWCATDDVTCVTDFYTDSASPAVARPFSPRLFFHNCYYFYTQLQLSLSYSPRAKKIVSLADLD